jgi:hypothetical protein
MQNPKLICELNSFLSFDEESEVNFKGKKMGRRKASRKRRASYNLSRRRIHK